VRGPAVFLLSLAGVALVGAFVVRPVKVERDRFAVEILERAASLPGRGAAQPPSRIGRLAEGIGLTRGPNHPENVVRLLAMDFTAMDRIQIRDGVVSFPMSWSDVPRLLRRLAAMDGLVIGKFNAGPFEAGPGGDPERCRIELEFAPPATGFGVR